MNRPEFAIFPPVRVGEEIEINGEGIGSSMLVKELVSVDYVEKRVALHQLYGVELNDYRHAVWVTQPSKYESDSGVYNLVNLPGLGEDVERGVGFSVHAELTKAFPEARTISIANNGLGQISGRFNPKRPEIFSLDDMAEQRRTLVEAFGEDERTFLLGTSMGSVIGNKMLNLELEEGQKTNIAGACWYAPALVTPDRVGIDMALMFIPRMVRDGAEEILLRTSPARWLGALSVLAASARGARFSWSALTLQARDLLQGTPIEEIKSTLEHYPTAVLAGTKDPVAQLPMWQKFERQHSNLILESIKDRGHAMTLNPEKAARKIGKTLRLTGIVAAGL